MTDEDVIAAIRRQHLKFWGSDDPHTTVWWHRATVDPGGALCGPGPYLHVPVGRGDDYIVIRVHAPERLRRRLAREWEPV